MKCKGGHTECAPVRSLFLAYMLWLFFPIPGAHLLYLGRDAQFSIHLLTCGALGLAWWRDMWCMGRYVELANGGPAPSGPSLTRIVAMLVSGSVCAAVGASLLAPPAESWLPPAWHPLATRLAQGTGAAAGVFWAGVTPPFGASLRWMLAAGAGCGLALALFAHDSASYKYGPAIAAVACFRLTMVVETAPRRRPFGRRIATVVLSLLLGWGSIGYAVYQHGYVTHTSHGRSEQIRLKDAVQHFLRSPLWRDIKVYMWRFAAEDTPRDGFFSAWERARGAMDLTGEGHACQVLGIPAGSSLSEAKAAHRSLVLETHPDKVSHGSDAEREAAQQRFLEVHAAYITLKELHGKRGAPARDEL